MKKPMAAWMKPFAFSLFTLTNLILSAPANAQLNFAGQTPFYEFTNAVGSGLVQVADFNGDGNVDVAVQTSISGGITYLQNNGSGSFSTPAGAHPFSNFTASTPSGFTLSITSTIVADYDSDGDLDIWTRINGSGNDIYLRNNNGTYASQVPFYEFTNAVGSGLVQVMDFNGDGHVDIAVQASIGGGITYLQNNGSGSYSTPAGTHPFTSYTSSTPAGFTFSIISTIVADYDSDGDLDIWCRINGAGNDIFMRNIGGIYASQTPFYEFTNAVGSGLVQVADFNGDGHVDFAVQSAIAGPITYMQNNGSGSYSTPVSNPFSGYITVTPALFTLAISSTIVADYDCDGDMDIWCRVNGFGNDTYLKEPGEAPRMISSNPINNAGNLAVNANIALGFSENVTTGAGNIYIRRLSDNVAVQTIVANSAAVTGSGTSSLTINPPVNLASHTTYYLTFDRNAIADTDEGLIFGSVNLTLSIRVPPISSSFLRFSTWGALPVSLTNLSVAVVDGKAQLKWQTVSESKSSHFIVQYSSNGSSWTDIGTVAAAGNSNSILNYQFTDAQVLQEKNYYRLVQVDIDGQKEISEIVLVKTGKSAVVKLYPNPSENEVNIQLPQSGAATVMIYSPGGQMIWQQKVNSRTVRVPVAQLAKGLYQVVIKGKNGEHYTESFLKN